MAQFEISSASDLQALFAGTYNPGSGVVTLQSGDIIKLAAGTYSASLIINKGVTITRADGVAKADIAITGAWTINSATAVTIDGVRFLNDKPIANGAGTSLLVHNPTGVVHVVENSIFDRDPTDNPPDPSAFQSVITNYAIRTQGAGGAGGGLTIRNNLFTGQNDVRAYANDVWANAIWSEGSVSTTLITGNEFENTRAGINAANFNANTQITGNTFHDMGTAITFGSGTTGTITTVTGNTFASDIDTELNLKNLTGAVDVRQIITGNTFSPAAQPMWIETGAGADTLLATSGADTFLTYKEGSADTAVDTVIYNDRITSLTKVDGGWRTTSSGNANADLLKGVDVIDDSGSGRILLVGTGGTAGSGGFATIQAAIDAASSGDTIMVAPGTYASFVVNKADLKIIGDGDSTIIQGTGANGSIGVSIQASGFTLQDVKVSNFHYNARAVADANDILIDDVTFSGGKIGFGKSTETDIHALTIKDSIFENLTIGVDLPTATAQGRVVDVEFLDNTFANITHKGIYAEALSNAVFGGVTMNNVGKVGNDSGLNGNGIDFNLKYASYTDITIRDFTLVDVGGADANGAAIAVKARNDGPSYSANPASFTGQLIIEDGSITGASVGIRAGEAGKVTTGPAVTIADVTIDSLVADIDNQTASTMKVDTTDYVLASTSTGYIDDGVADTITVGAGGDYATIQEAIDNAHEGDVIQVAAGVYNEKIIVDVDNLTIAGAPGAIIKGGFSTDNSGIAGKLSDWIGPQTSYNANSGAGVTVRADGFTLRSIKIDDFYQGVRFDTDVQDIALTEVNIENSLFGLHKTTTADIDGLTITGGSIVDGYQGTDFTKSTASLTDGQLKNVAITGTRFEDLSAKGIYTEALANALISGVTMTNVGVYGRGDSFGDIGQHGAGIDINLKSGAYSGITIQNFTFTDVGTSNGAGTSHNNAGAITIKARDDAPSYNANPATFTGAVIIRNGTIDGTSTGVRVGEEGKTVGGPEVDITNVRVTDYVDNADHGAFINDTTKVMDVTFTAAGYSFDFGPSSGNVNYVPFVVTPDPEEEEPTTPPPPSPGQGPGTTPEEVIDNGFGVVTGVDPTSAKATDPVIILPNGQEIPNPVYEEAKQLADISAQFKAGLISEATVIDKMVEFAADTTAVALQAYQFFTGATPTREGVAYLVNSDDNENDLTDPYYATFSADNRYINFAVSLGTGGQGSQQFAQEYGALSFEDSIRSAYDKIIGVDEATAAGVDVNAAIAYVMTQLAYFTALGGSAIGAKAAMVGYLMYAGMQAKIGIYYEGTRGFLTDAFHGEADYNVDLTGGSSGLTSSHLDFGLA
ncbi:hypothetical protein P7B02_06275 [Caulobacter segnis]|uniref:hypothetical protein n=1 Tax=Caulobacter segnis TaxID=88688 RepID=UPI00240EF522|nr:hypothetical protein [Caulobacter segnis]MDG2521143.1 hypothetical protein [Caulobacter segnis]